MNHCVDNKRPWHFIHVGSHKLKLPKDIHLHLGQCDTSPRFQSTTVRRVPSRSTLTVERGGNFTWCRISVRLCRLWWLPSKNQQQTFGYVRKSHISSGTDSVTSSFSKWFIPTTSVPSWTPEGTITQTWTPALRVCDRMSLRILMYIYYVFFLRKVWGYICICVFSA